MGCEVLVLSVRIYAVTAGSPAEKAGIKQDERILSVNGEDVTDEIDYQALTAVSDLTVRIENENGVRTLSIRKEEWEPLGLCLDETESMKPRHCRNKCVLWISCPKECGNLYTSRMMTGD